MRTLQKAWALVHKDTGEIVTHKYANRKLHNYLIYDEESQANRAKSALYKHDDNIEVQPIAYGVLPRG